MTTELNGEHSKVFSCKTKIPIDVRIVAYFLYAIGFFQLACSCLLITGIARLGDITNHLSFGISLPSAELSISILILCLGFIHLLCAWGLIRSRNFSWWLLLIKEMYYIIVGVFLFQVHRLNALIGLGISISIIAWLFFRRHLYNVGFK
jgi:hypothetical protein